MTRQQQARLSENIDWALIMVNLSVLIALAIRYFLF
jgi:hypothetical protein